MKQGSYSNTNCHMLMECSLVLRVLIWSLNPKVSTDALFIIYQHYNIGGRYIGHQPRHCTVWQRDSVTVY